MSIKMTLLALPASFYSDREKFRDVPHARSELYVAIVKKLLYYFNELGMQRGFQHDLSKWYSS